MSHEGRQGTCLIYKHRNKKYHTPLAKEIGLPNPSGQGNWPCENNETLSVFSDGTFRILTSRLTMKQPTISY
jgi:hypothetical protein